MTDKACPVCGEHSRDALTCWPCIRKTRRDLAELPWLYLETRRASLGIVRLSAREGSRSSETPMPINLRASRIADTVRSGIVGWVRIAVDRGADWPADKLAAMCSLLADRARDLRHHEAFPELVTDVTQWTADMLHVVNRPAIRRIEVGPCPLDTTTDDGTARCAGTVYAILPADTDAMPVHAACSWCCDPEADPMVGLWVAQQWSTLGRLIAKRQAADERARELAQSIAKVSAESEAQ